VIKKEAEKIVKYKDLIIEIQRMWNVKAKMISVIRGATGTITKSLRRYLNNIPGKQEIKELQKKNSHTGQCTHTAESANVKVENIFHGQNNVTCSANCNYRTAATLYVLETWFVSGI
jgi:ethanolamine utilization protein EutQ (cupin superfamily)